MYLFGITNLWVSTFSWKFKPKLRPVATSHRDGQISTLVQRKFGLDPLLREKDKPTALIKEITLAVEKGECIYICLLYTSPSPRDFEASRMPSSA